MLEEIRAAGIKVNGMAYSAAIKVRAGVLKPLPQDFVFNLSRRR